MYSFYIVQSSVFNDLPKKHVQIYNVLFIRAALGLSLAPFFNFFFFIFCTVYFPHDLRFNQIFATTKVYSKLEFTQIGFFFLNLPQKSALTNRMSVFLVFRFANYLIFERIGRRNR